MVTPHQVTAVPDPSLRATLRDLAPLPYHRASPAGDDIPAFVRAASAIRRDATRRIVIQDDINAFGILALDGSVTPYLLPVGPGGRRTFGEALGNKRDKMDLEACVMLAGGRLLAFGSGSTAARERLVLLSGEVVSIVDGSELYEKLRALRAFSGSELNLEGAVVVGDTLRLFQRGNGASLEGIEPCNATCDLPLAEVLRWLEGGPAPTIDRVVRYDLGSIRGTPFTFTDATVTSDGSVAFIACAEASPDTYNDGEVLGCCFGLMGATAIRVATIVDPAGEPTKLKIEGVEARADEPGVFDVVIDMDRQDTPAQLGTLVVVG